MEETIWRTIPLYVYSGEKHNGCDNKNLIHKKCSFFRGREKFYQEIGFCPKCKKYFILQNNMANLSKFCDYNLFHAMTLERIKVNSSTNWKDSNVNVQAQKKKKPFDNSWSLRHPMQGGSCSGK